LGLLAVSLMARNAGLLLLVRDFPLGASLAAGKTPAHAVRAKGAAVQRQPFNRLGEIAPGSLAHETNREVKKP